MNNRPKLQILIAAVLFAAACTSLTSAVSLAAAQTSCGLEGVERIVAIGDVHGAYDRFVEILRSTGIIDERQRWAGGKAHLVQLGDIVDRGPDSRKALDLVRRLEGDAASAGGAVHALLGNHEVARILGDLRFVVPGEYEAFVTSDSETIRRRYVESLRVPNVDEVVKATPLGQVEMRIAFGREGTYGKWLRSHDTVVKIDGVLFVHGGISPAVASRTCDDINATVRRELTTDLDKTRAAPLASLAAREDSPAWYRGLAEAQEGDASRAQVDDLLAKQKARAIVVAHTVVITGRIQARFGGKVTVIDTGMQPAYVQNGRASALEIQNGKFTAIYVDGREPLDTSSLASQVLDGASR